MRPVQLRSAQLRLGQMRPVQLKPAQLRPAQLRPEHFESAVRRQLTKRRGEWEELIWSLSFDQSIAK